MSVAHLRLAPEALARTLASPASGRHPAPAAVLVVDDEDEVRASLTRLLSAQGYTCADTRDAAGAVELLSSRRFEAVLCDLRLPGTSGLDLVGAISRDHPDVVPIVITGAEDPRLAERASRLGAAGYLVKPFTPGQLLAELASARTRHRHAIGPRPHGRELPGGAPAGPRRRRQRTPPAPAGAARQRALEETIRALARAVEYREHGAGGHPERVGEYCALIARKLCLERRRCALIRTASLLHDIGKLAVPDRILLKPGPLTREERAAVERHAEIGYRVLAAGKTQLLELAAVIAWTHHERFDGRGYPRRLSGEAIPIEGRIAAVADVFDALTSDRVYRPAVSLAEAVRRIRAERGGAFDPAVADALVGSLAEVIGIRQAIAAAGPGEPAPARGR